MSAKKKTAKKATKKKGTENKVTKKTAVQGKTSRLQAPATLGSCFVMMPFRAPFDRYYESVFRPAIVAARLEPVKANDLFRPSPIVHDLWKMIQDAKVLLAELTTKNANVFYELGLGHAIGKPIVMISETMDDVPFDLQQLRVLKYDKNDPAWGEKLASSITKALTETLESPVEAVPHLSRHRWQPGSGTRGDRRSVGNL